MLGDLASLQLDFWFLLAGDASLTCCGEQMYLPAWVSLLSWFMLRWLSDDCREGVLGRQSGWECKRWEEKQTKRLSGNERVMPAANPVFSSEDERVSPAKKTFAASRELHNALYLTPHFPAFLIDTVVRSMSISSAPTQCAHLRP